MRLVAALVVGMLAVSGRAAAQSVPPSKGYVEFVGQATLGDVTSGSFGVEAGMTVLHQLQAFVEVGRALNVAPASLSDGALLIAGFLSQSQNSVAYSASEPLTFGILGARYPVLASSKLKLEPYLLGGAGFGHTSKDVTFSIGSTDVTSTIGDYGVVLGTDLSGHETSAMMSLGGGVVWTVHGSFILDVQYRYGRLFASEEGLNINRLGVGLGVRF